MASNSRELLLRAIGASNQLPDAQLIADYQSSNLKTLPLTNEERDQLAAKERERLAEFREQYWSLEPSDRTRRWTQLRNGCDSKESHAILDRWKLGLTIPSIPAEELKESKLKSFVAETFLLPPRERAIRRLRWLNEVAIPNQTVLNFLKQNVAFYSLDPLFFQDLVKKNGMSVREFLTADFAKDLDHDSFQFVRKGKGFTPVGAMSEREVLSLENRKRKASQNEVILTQPDSGFSWRYIWLFFVVLGGLLRGFASCDRTPTYSSPSPAYNYQTTGQPAKLTDNQNKAIRDLLEKARKNKETMDKPFQNGKDLKSK